MDYVSRCPRSAESGAPTCYDVNDLYKNKKKIAGLSVMKKVTWEDEWLAEAYMETDYTQLSNDSFQKVINDYLSYVVKTGDFKND